MNLARESISERRLSIEEQRDWLDQVREALRASPLVRPRTPNGLDMRVRVSAAGELGWVGDGAYRYSRTDARGEPWPPIPQAWKDLADEVTGSLWQRVPAQGPRRFAWDCAIINWYDADASLGWHRDLAERDLSLPIVTVSLGDACSWAMRLDEDESVHRTRLESGEVTVLSGRTRMALHTVERIIPAPLLSPLSVRGRVSVTLRVAG